MPKGPDTAPEREAALNQLDLFTALPGDLPTHDQQEMMERPFFSLSKGKRIEPIDYHVRNGTTEGPSRDWGSGGDRHWRAWIVGWVESLSEAGTERAIIDGAPNLQQQVGAASRPTHLL